MSQNFKREGFTLMELLIYVAITAVVGGILSGALLIMTQVQNKEFPSAEVTGQLNFVMQNIQRFVRDSSSIELNAGVTGSVLKLRMKDLAKDPTCVSLVGGVIKLAEGPGSNPNDCSATTSDITSNRVIVDNLEFKKFSQYPGHDVVSIDIIMTYNANNSQSRVQRSLKSAIARISAATFDSNLLPGSGSFELGQAGSPWRKIYLADGTAGEPSYTFGSNNTLGFFKTAANSLGITNGLEVTSNGYLQFSKTSSGAPPSGDCDSDGERGRMIIDTTNNRLYVCNGSGRGWDYIELTN